MGAQKIAIPLNKSITKSRITNNTFMETISNKEKPNITKVRCASRSKDQNKDRHLHEKGSSSTHFEVQSNFFNLISHNNPSWQIIRFWLHSSLKQMSSNNCQTNLPCKIMFQTILFFYLLAFLWVQTLGHRYSFYKRIL